MFDGENSSMAIIRIMASLKALIPKGDGHNNDYAKTLSEAARAIDELRYREITCPNCKKELGLDADGCFDPICDNHLDG